jgi:ribosomal protein L37AE/L43A
MSKKPDYLTLCSIAAQKAGTSYGKYMAMHGYHPPIRADVEDVEAPHGVPKICPQCGKEFTQGKIMQKIYCSLECQKMISGRRWRRYPHVRINSRRKIQVRANCSEPAWEPEHGRGVFCNMDFPVHDCRP